MEDKIELIKGVNGGNKVTGEEPEAKRESEIGQFVSEAMSDAEKINSLMTTSKPEVTIFVGFEGYGKTTFVASCYHLLLSDGGINDYCFYDSETLTGFERRLYLRRLSETTIEVAPATKRTIRGEPYLLTLHLKHKNGKEKLIVISDHSGEDYSNYASQKKNIENDVLMMNADRIIFFVDASKITSNEYLSVKNMYSQLLTNMNEYSVFERDKLKLDLLFTKIDLVEDKRDDFEKRKKEVINKFKSILPKDISKVHEICATKVENNETLKALFFDIIDNTANDTPVDAGNSDLDWVKVMIKNK